MTNLLDERIDQHQSMDWTYQNRAAPVLFAGAQYQGIADTIVQLSPRNTSDVITQSQPIRPEEGRWKKPTGGK